MASFLHTVLTVWTFEGQYVVGKSWHFVMTKFLRTILKKENSLEFDTSDLDAADF